MKHLLSDSTNFEKFNIEENEQIKFILSSGKRLNDIIKTLHGCFTKAEYDKAYPKGLKLGILYGSAKVKPVIDDSLNFDSLLSATGTRKI